MGARGAEREQRGAHHSSGRHGTCAASANIRGPGADARFSPYAWRICARASDVDGSWGSCYVPGLGERELVGDVGKTNTEARRRLHYPLSASAPSLNGNTGSSGCV